MRQIVLDTETTGLLTTDGHRIIEIGCVELIDRRFTGNDFHHYINPEREIETEALAVHGITSEFLAEKPRFADIIDDFLNYINGAEIIAHNADFDVGFINYEMKLSKKKQTLEDFTTIFDTLALARKMFPGQRNNLDALCKRMKVNATERKFHGALLDANLLAQVYLLMTGGQGTLFADEFFAAHETKTKKSAKSSVIKQHKPTPMIHASADELSQHKKIITNIQKISGKSYWNENCD